MTPDEAEDWLAVAVGEVLCYPFGTVERACGEARRTCTHHSQIIPAVIKAADALQAERNRYSEWDIPRLPAPPPEPMAIEEFTAIVNERGRALSWALDTGSILSNGDGTFSLPDGSATLRPDPLLAAPVEPQPPARTVRVDPAAPRTLAELAAKWGDPAPTADGEALQ